MLPFKGRNRLTSPFGVRTLNGVKNDHKGVDLVGDDDTTVHAVEGGTVQQSRIVTDKSNLTWQWGHYVCIRTASGRLHYYCHLASRAVKVGDTVKAGDKLGVMGSTGYCFGAHLHFEVRTAAGASINPCPTLGIANAVGTYTGSETATKPANNEEDEMKIKIFAAQDKTPSSQLLKEGWIMDGQGNMFNPAGEARILKEYGNDISAVYEAMRKELQPGEIMMVMED